MSYIENVLLKCALKINYYTKSGLFKIYQL